MSNPPHMKHFYLLALIWFSGVVGYSQTTVSFVYDNSGNRTSRTSSGLKSTIESTIDQKSIDSLSILIGQKSIDSLSDQIDEYTIMVYPNPVSSEINVEIQGIKENSVGTISLFDLNGRLVMSRNEISSTNLLFLSHLPSGTYFMIIHLEETVSKWTILKE